MLVGGLILGSDDPLAETDVTSWELRGGRFAFLKDRSLTGGLLRRGKHECMHDRDEFLGIFGLVGGGVGTRLET